MSSCPLPAAPGAPARGGHRHNFYGFIIYTQVRMTKLLVMTNKLRLHYIYTSQDDKITIDSDALSRCQKNQKTNAAPIRLLDLGPSVGASRSRSCTRTVRANGGIAGGGRREQASEIRTVSTSLLIRAGGADSRSARPARSERVRRGARLCSES